MRFTEALWELFSEMLPLYIHKAHDRVGTKVESKESDGTPVVDLDRHSLGRLRKLISDYFPGERTIGEEDGAAARDIAEIVRNQHEVQWTIDGLDGTWHYIRNTNSFGAMVSRRFGNQVLYAAAFRPVDMALRRNGFFVADPDHGTREWCRDCFEYHQLRTARPGALERTTVLLEGVSKNFFRPPITSLGSRITTRPSLSSCIAATTVARGGASAVVTVGNKPWDNWPMIAIIEGAGGIVTDYRGNPRRLEDCGDIVAAANEQDLEDVIRALNS